MGDRSKHLSAHSIFIAKNLATSTLSLPSVIQIPSNLTDPTAIILYCGLESNHLQDVNQIINFKKLTSEQFEKSVSSKNPEDFLDSSNFEQNFLNAVFNLPLLHDHISKHGEAILTPTMRNFYLKFAKCLYSKPLILSDEEKARLEKIALAWSCHEESSSTRPSVEVKTRSNKNEGTDSQSASKILPKANERNIMISSALPYVNNVPHLGNIIGCVLSADAVARFQRNAGRNVIYICGTDEYGTATEVKALQENLSCQEICDKYHNIHKHVYKWFQISFDHFGRTTTEQQTEIAQDIFNSLKKAGKIREKEVDQLYDKSKNMFLADRYVTGTCPLCSFDDARGDQCDGCGQLLNATQLIDPVSILSKTTPTIKVSKHQFIKLDEIEPSLKAWLADSLLADKITSRNTKAITKHWLNKGLTDRCITRDLKWGTKVPLKGYEDKVFYVWFDAPIGYISITANYTTEWRQWWYNPEQVEYMQFMAKDNVPFHAVVFPSTQIGTGQNWTKVTSLNATEYLNYESGKFSKSRGVGVFGNHAEETGIESDYWRFYLLFIRPEEKDTEFNWEDFQSKVNSDLLKNFGNFVNRPLNLVAKFWGSKLPSYEGPNLPLQERDKEFINAVNEQLLEYSNCFELCHIRSALRSVLKISGLGNQYLQDLEPWKLKKTDNDRAGQIVSLSIQLVVLLAVLIEPFMPVLSGKIMSQLGFDNSVKLALPDIFGPSLKSGHELGKPSPLISQISKEVIEACREKYKGEDRNKVQVLNLI